MEFRLALAKAIKQARAAKGLTQEDFSGISSRTYLSILERGQKSPTLAKIIDISEVMDIHFMTLLALTLLHTEEEMELELLLDQIKQELEYITQLSA